MLDLFSKQIPNGCWKNPLSEQFLLSEILSLNGKPSVHQIEMFRNWLSSKGIAPPSADSLSKGYQADLRESIERRIALINGAGVRDEFVIWNAKAILQFLESRRLTLIILSGTVEHEVKAEAQLLGLSRYFGRHIYGAPRRGAFSKRDVINRLIKQEGIEGHQLLAFGDGPVEIQCTKEVGGLAIGVASSEEENGSHLVNPLKRDQLIRAGADAIIPDYECAEELLAAIFPQ